MFTKERKLIALRSKRKIHLEEKKKRIQQKKSKKIKKNQEEKKIIGENVSIKIFNNISRQYLLYLYSHFYAV